MKPKKLGLFFGSSTCYTDIVAEKIAAIIQRQHSQWAVDLHNIATTPISQAEHYNYAIYGIPTWDYGELQEDWDDQWEQLQTLDLSQQQGAIYGLGDQAGYPDYFQDALGFLYSQLQACGATMYGLWPTTINQWVAEEALIQYSYRASQGLTDDQCFFLGLPLDEENQPELTKQRLNIWLERLLKEFEH